jgi:cell wall-associated NlpC family hydrolase
MMTRAAVAAEALSWLGTPYHHNARVKGAGVDCAMLLAEVFERCGLVERVEPGDYPHDWHLHHGTELFLEWLERSGARETEAPLIGDVAVYRFGRTFSHGAIVVAEGLQLAHAYIGRGVILTRASEEPLSGRVRRYFTLFD